jgi:hypothetical protein
LGVEPAAQELVVEAVQDVPTVQVVQLEEDWQRQEMRLDQPVIQAPMDCEGGR